MKKYKVLATERFQVPDLLKGNVLIDVYDELWKSPEDIATKANDYDALIVRNMTQVDSCLIEQLKSIKVIGRLGAGVENIDIDSAYKYNIPVVYAPIQNTNAVAEYCVGQTFNILRHLPTALEETKTGLWNRSKYLSSGREVRNCNIGVVGFGHIGKAFSKKMLALGANISIYNRTPSKVTPPFKCVDLETLLQNSDIISIHLPGGDKTKDFINKEKLSLIKKGAYILNSSRGAIINESDLLLALESGDLGGAILDVRTVEPAEFDPISKHPNVYLTPHIAAFTQESQIDISKAVLSDIIKVLQGKSPIHPVKRNK